MLNLCKVRHTDRRAQIRFLTLIILYFRQFVNRIILLSFSKVFNKLLTKKTVDFFSLPCYNIIVPRKRNKTSWLWREIFSMTMTLKTNDHNFVARFDCTFEGTRYGFRHLCILFYYDLNDDTIYESALDKCCYYNGLGKVIRTEQSCAKLSWEQLTSASSQSEPIFWKSST